MSAQDYKILIVDDEPLIRKSLSEILRLDGYDVKNASTGKEALDILKEYPIDILITDLRLPSMSGIDLIKKIKHMSLEVEIIVITGYGSIESAVTAMKEGAFDYLTKPINDTEIRIIINKIIEKKRILLENIRLKEILEKDRRQEFCEMIGASHKMQSVYNIIESVASTNATVLITGESGTGKGLAAKAIHEWDKKRGNKSFVDISCAALSDSSLESELFGHVQGAFPGAVKNKKGRFEYADQGTIFLDGIDAFSLRLQAKLLKVLHNGTFERVGDNTEKKTDVRIIVATNKNLLDLVKKDLFREELYYRINVISLEMPSLRDRKEDIDALINHFIKKYGELNNKKVTDASKKVRKLFRQYHWPGNVRELENAIEAAVIMANGRMIHSKDVSNFNEMSDYVVPVDSDQEKPLRKVVEQPEREYILSVLRNCNWNKKKAAIFLGVNRSTLYNKLKKYGIDRE